MTYETKPFPFDLKAINDRSEKNLVSHYENNYIRAVKRLNAIGVQLAEPMADRIARHGQGRGGGPGWMILDYSSTDKRLVDQWAADHMTTLAGGRPVLVLDMYEHAYHIDRRQGHLLVGAYVEAISWDNAARLEHYRSET
jgi:superoxide dismutase, Fe-Mn family